MVGSQVANFNLRPVADDDEQFLVSLYASTRADELAPVPWTAEEKQLFLTQQFHAQDVAYRSNYPDGSFSVVELDGVPIGRMIVTRLEGNELRIVDIALLHEHRNMGIGNRLIGDVLDGAQGDGLMVSLHVEVWNPAVKLYERLGFRGVSANDVHLRMERAAAS
jgi:ribosomal protein S18 acetylase RimI-like enzyme